MISRIRGRVDGDGNCENRGRKKLININFEKKNKNKTISRYRSSGIVHESNKKHRKKKKTFYNKKRCKFFSLSLFRVYTNKLNCLFLIIFLFSYINCFLEILKPSSTSMSIFFPFFLLLMMFK